MSFPAYLLTNEMTRKQFWLMAFSSALARLPASEALAEADVALRVSDDRWHSPEAVSTFQFVHNYPVGYDYSKATPSTAASADIGDQTRGRT